MLTTPILPAHCPLPSGAEEAWARGTRQNHGFGGKYMLHSLLTFSPQPPSTCVHEAEDQARDPRISRTPGPTVGSEHCGGPHMTFSEALQVL